MTQFDLFDAERAVVRPEAPAGTCAPSGSRESHQGAPATENQQFGERMRPLIVNGNPAYARYLIERCGLPEDTEVMDTVTPEDVSGRHVFGNLPPQLAAHASKISQLSVPGGQGIRMSKMSLAQFRYFGGDITTYRVELLATSPAPRR